MKTKILSIIGAVVMGVTAVAQDGLWHTFDWMQNPYLPLDTVELAQWETQWTTADFWQIKPTTRPLNVPAEYVLVKVFQQRKEGGWMFAGWFYMEPTMVNWLHERQMEIL